MPPPPPIFFAQIDSRVSILVTAFRLLYFVFEMSIALKLSILNLFLGCLVMPREAIGVRDAMSDKKCVWLFIFVV